MKFDKCIPVTFFKLILSEFLNDNIKPYDYFIIRHSFIKTFGNYESNRYSGNNMSDEQVNVINKYINEVYFMVEEIHIFQINKIYASGTNNIFGYEKTVAIHNSENLIKYVGLFNPTNKIEIEEKRKIFVIESQANDDNKIVINSTKYISMDDYLKLKPSIQKKEYKKIYNRT